MLFQQIGGLQIQISETLRELNNLGLEARLFDVLHDNLQNFSIIHVFGIIHGNHEIIRMAKQKRVPVVVTPVIHPPLGNWQANLAAACDSAIGRLTSWRFQSTYRFYRYALTSADFVAVLGQNEREIVVDIYGVNPGRVRIVPNGISPHFFRADSTAFRERFGINGDFVLSVSTISPYKNQLALIKALFRSDYEIILIGPCGSENAKYLKECERIGGDKVRYLGPVDHSDSLLPSAYAAAKVFALVSHTECAPLSVLEALAAGTPAVLTRNNSLDLSRSSAPIRLASPRDPTEIRRATMDLVRQNYSPEACVSSVADYTWANTAKALYEIYALLGRHTEI